MKNSSTIWIWLFIVMFGFSIISSFYTVNFSGFDGWFFLIAVAYIVISNISFIFIEKAVANNSGRVSKAKRKIYSEYLFLDENNLWDSLLTYDLISRYTSLFTRASSIYRGCLELETESKTSQYSETEIREMVVKKQFSATLKSQGYNGKHLKMIKRMEKQSYKPNYFWDKQFNKYKNGSLLNQSSNSSIYALISLLLAIGGIVTSIVLTINILSETKLFEKLLLLAIIFVADLITDVLTIRRLIVFEEEHAKTISECVGYFFKNVKSANDTRYLNYFCNCEKGIYAITKNATFEDAINIIKSIDPLFFDKNTN